MKSKKRTVKRPDVKMGNKPVELRLWKVEDRINQIEANMDMIFHANRVKSANYYGNAFWHGHGIVHRKGDRAGARRLAELYLQRALAITRLTFYQKLLDNELD